MLLLIIVNAAAMKAPSHIMIFVQIFFKEALDVYPLTMAYFQMENLKKAVSEDDKKRSEDKKQSDVYESHSKFMKSKVST